MKKLLLSYIAATSIFSCVGNSCYASSLHKELDFVNEIANAIQHANDHPDVWPGFNISSTPSIVYFSNLHNYAYDFLPINANWKQIQRQGKPIFFLEKDEYGINNQPWGYGVLIDNQQSYLFHYMDILDLNANRHIFLHERFHMYQLEAFPREFLLYMTQPYTGFNHIENVKLSYLEIKVLNNYLLNSNIDSLKDYVAINQYRENLIGVESSQYEQGKEMMEGLADYYAYTVANKDDESRKISMIKSYQNVCSLENVIKCEMHQRYYFTGAVVGVALDQLAINGWKEKMIKDRISIRGQLYRALPMNEAQIKKRIESAKIRYHYEELTKPIEQELISFQVELKNKQDTYSQMDGVILNIKKTPCNLFGQIKSEKEYFISSNTLFNTNVVGNSSCQDGSIKVNYLHLPFVFESDEYKNEFKIASDTKITINGITTSAKEFLEAGRSVKFDSLSIANQMVTIESKGRHGDLNVEANKISLKYSD